MTEFCISEKVQKKLWICYWMYRTKLWMASTLQIHYKSFMGWFLEEKDWSSWKNCGFCFKTNKTPLLADGSDTEKMYSMRRILFWKKKQCPRHRNPQCDMWVVSSLFRPPHTAFATSGDSAYSHSDLMKVNHKHSQSESLELTTKNCNITMPDMLHQLIWESVTYSAHFLS
jgi:hypothetical protein